MWVEIWIVLIYVFKYYVIICREYWVTMLFLLIVYMVIIYI